MDIKDYYEGYWKNKDELDTFWGYERNWVLPKLFNKGEKVLDLACGDGAVSSFLQNEIGVDVTGVDISKKAADEAIKRGINVKIVDVEKSRLPFKKEQFDKVFWGDNIEHLFEPEKVVKEIYRVLMVNGKLILSYPNMSYWRYRLYYFLKGSISETEWSGYKQWEWMHIRFFNHSIVSELLENNGFKVEKEIGVSRRKPDKYLLSISPSLFGMITVTVARKTK